MISRNGYLRHPDECGCEGCKPIVCKHITTGQAPYEPRCPRCEEQGIISRPRKSDRFIDTDTRDLQTPELSSRVRCQRCHFQWDLTTAWLMSELGADYLTAREGWKHVSSGRYRKPPSELSEPVGERGKDFKGGVMQKGFDQIERRLWAALAPGSMPPTDASPLRLEELRPTGRERDTHYRDPYFREWLEAGRPPGPFDRKPEDELVMRKRGRGRPSEEVRKAQRIRIHKFYRRNPNASSRTLAKQCGVSHTTVLRVLNDKSSTPRAESRGKEEGVNVTKAEMMIDALVDRAAERAKDRVLQELTEATVQKADIIPLRAVNDESH